MPDDIQFDKDKFDAVLRRMATMKPMSVKELSAKLKAEREAKKARGPVQKNGLAPKALIVVTRGLGNRCIPHLGRKTLNNSEAG